MVGYRDTVGRGLDPADQESALDRWPATFPLRQKRARKDQRPDVSSKPLILLLNFGGP